VIHRDTCGNVEDYRKRPEKWLPISWQHKIARLFQSEIRIETVNRMGVLAAVSASIANSQTNIDHVSIEQRDAELTVLVFVLVVMDRKHLARVMRTVRRMPDVLRVVRTIAGSRRHLRRGNDDGTDALEAAEDGDSDDASASGD